MAEQKLFAGHAVRRLRRQLLLTQAAMAEALGVSASYLNLVERNQRPVSAMLMLRLSEVYDFDPRKLAAAEPGGGMEALRRRLADPLFADLEIDRQQMEEWLAGAPGGAEAFARAYDRIGAGGPVADAGPGDPGRQVRREIERWRNHFADLDAVAEALADALRQTAGDPYGAMAERLRVKHQLSVRILPADVMPGLLKRLDLHARQVQLSELLDMPGRTFALAERLSQEARGEIEALVRGAGLDRAGERLYQRHLVGYFAAAVMMPYGRFLRACEQTGYDLDVLRRRFGASFEQVAHRLSTLQRPGLKGVPIFFARIDRAGNITKRHSAAKLQFARFGAACPLWNVHQAFEQPGRIIRQLAETPDGARYLCVATELTKGGGGFNAPQRRYAIALGCEVAYAGDFVYADKLDHGNRAAFDPIGISCRICERTSCPQRAVPPLNRKLVVDHNRRGAVPYEIA